MEGPLDVTSMEGAVLVSLAKHRLIEGLEAHKVGRAILAFADDAPGTIVIDFTGVLFVSSAFVGTLVDLYQKIAPKSVALRLCGMNANVHKVFQVTRLDRLFTIDQTREDSVAALERKAGPK